MNGTRVALVNVFAQDGLRCSSGRSVRRIRWDRRSPEDGPARRRCEPRVPALRTESPILYAIRPQVDNPSSPQVDNPSSPPPLPMASAARKPAHPGRADHPNPFETGTCIAQQERRILHMRNVSPLALRRRVRPASTPEKKNPVVTAVSVSGKRGIELAAQSAEG
jgi:hypothetical protein